MISFLQEYGANASSANACRQFWADNVSTLSELLRKAAAGSEDEAGAEQVG
jgi:hypothetical protein